MIDHSKFYDECEAAGLPRPRSISGDTPTFPRKLTTEEAVTLEKLVAAHGKSSTSLERLDLATALSVEAKTAYYKLRDDQVKAARQERYAVEADPLLFNALAGADPAKAAAALGIKQADFEAWQTERQKITDAIPY